MSSNGNGDRRLIEDYLPIDSINSTCVEEQNVKVGHPHRIHMWWATRPLAACRAAVYGALDPAPAGKNGRGPKSDFVKRLCKYPGNPAIIKQAQQHILEAHADRLSKELGKIITVKDIDEERVPRPRVLDMFAGGGSIPLEALRLGCEAYALELNPVAHLIELCTLVYPQKYSKPDNNVKGSAQDCTWAGLTKEVEYWGKWVLENAKKETEDLYPSINVSKLKIEKSSVNQNKLDMKERTGDNNITLSPIAYLWTRTVKCRKPDCGAIVHLSGLDWISQSDGRYIALNPILEKENKDTHYSIVSAKSKEEIAFDPTEKSISGVCPFCGTVAHRKYIREEGKSGRLGEQLMAVVCHGVDGTGKVYFGEQELSSTIVPSDEVVRNRIEDLCKRTGLTIPEEPIINDGKDALFCVDYGLTRWCDMFTQRQLLAMLTFTMHIRRAYQEILFLTEDAGRALAVESYLALILTNYCHYGAKTSLWLYEHMISCFYPGNTLPMRLDFAEANPFGRNVGSWNYSFKMVTSVLQKGLLELQRWADVRRGSAHNATLKREFFDAVITDPPYYDNIPYSDLSDMFYVWHKRILKDALPEHYASELTPKKNEIVMDSSRFDGDGTKAKKFYQDYMGLSFAIAKASLKKEGILVLIYAHKTTAGWETLVDALRFGGFMISEAWPIRTERSSRKRGHKSASLASNIFLIARRLESNEFGLYDTVKAELESIVRERVETFWKEGISGADLVIAAVGAGLRAFTRYPKVEYSNGEEVPSEKFLTEVEGAVLETLLEKIFNIPRSGVAGVDAATRFYVLWRYTYKYAEIDAGEAIVFAYPQGVELDSPKGLSAGSNSLLEKKKNKYRLRDFTERGNNENMGFSENGTPAPLIDLLHRILWLMENQDLKINEFLEKATPPVERLRLVAQALKGHTLGGSAEEISAPEQTALGKLLANWRSVIEEGLIIKRETESKVSKQMRLEVE